MGLGSCQVKLSTKFWLTLKSDSPRVVRWSKKSWLNKPFG